MNLDSIYRHSGSIGGLVQALSIRDQHTQLHCQRVVKLATDLGEWIGLEPEDLEILGISAGFHDIGKIGIPDTILLKAGALTAAERAIMESHTEKGEAIIRAMSGDYFREVAAVVRHHHEHFAGSGYPDRLAGTAIPLLARILGIVDSYDAMTERRSYRDALDPAVALAHMEAERGGKHDPQLLEAFFSMLAPTASRAH